MSISYQSIPKIGIEVVLYPSLGLLNCLKFCPEVLGAVKTASMVSKNASHKSNLGKGETELAVCARIGV